MRWVEAKFNYDVDNSWNPMVVKGPYVRIIATGSLVGPADGGLMSEFKDRFTDVNELAKSGASTMEELVKIADSA